MHVPFTYFLKLQNYLSLKIKQRNWYVQDTKILHMLSLEKSFYIHVRRRITKHTMKQISNLHLKKYTIPFCIAHGNVTNHNY